MTPKRILLLNEEENFLVKKIQFKVHWSKSHAHYWRGFARSIHKTLEKERKTPQLCCWDHAHKSFRIKNFPPKLYRFRSRRTKCTHTLAFAREKFVLSHHWEERNFFCMTTPYLMKMKIFLLLLSAHTRKKFSPCIEN